MANDRRLAAELESKEFDASGIQIQGLRGWERISQLFWFELDLVMREGAALPDDASPGAAVTLSLRDVDGTLRLVHGMIEWVRDRLDGHRKHRTYVMRIVPTIARLRLVETQEIFLDMTVPEIIRQKLDLHGLADDRLKVLAEGCPKREFVVQYRETDLAFVSRLAEHLGISFVFDHGDDAGEKVIFTDDVVHAGLPDALEELPYRTEGEREGVFFLEVERRMLPTTYMVQDYNYRAPLAEITGSHALASGGEPLGNGGGVVEYGTHHKTKDEGDKLAKVRAEERLSQREVFHGKSALLGLTAGARPKLVGHPVLEEPRLLIVEVEHRATFALDGAEASTDSYANAFVAVSAANAYRPPRTTPRPRIHGLVTGIVALGAHGKVGGPAQIDEEGRYTIQLHFDTVTHAGEERASHPIRMAQPFAGPNHGMHFPLRPGAEVVIAFLDGDPDRPIIVGSVPNAIGRSATTAANSRENRIESASGIVFQFSENT